MHEFRKRCDICEKICLLPSKTLTCEGEIAKIKLPDIFGAKIQWQVSKDGGCTFKDISLNGNCPTLKIRISESKDGYLYRAKITDKCSCKITNPTKLDVGFIRLLKNPESFICSSVGDTIIFSASAEGNPEPIIQWQFSVNNIIWINLPGENSDELILENVQLNQQGFYRAVFTNRCGRVISNATELSLTPKFDYMIIHDFDPNVDDGLDPVASLIQGIDELLYGTTSGGGINFGGITFKLNVDGSGYTPLHEFPDPGITNDGNTLRGRLLQASDGFFYGTTSFGGDFFFGIIFRMDSTGANYSKIHDFGSILDDGENPLAGLIQASDGFLYGTTQLGGADDMGTVFRISLDGTIYQVIYDFGSIVNDGNEPFAPLIQASNGLLYGTTLQGGANDLGTIFRLNLDGSGYTIIRDLAAADGTIPRTGLIQAENGLLYGTTSLAGASGAGTVYEINLDGTIYNVRKNFGAGIDGNVPAAPVIQANDGLLYGTTSAGGLHNLGNVYKLQTDGSGFQPIHQFAGQPNDGSNPEAGLLQAANCFIYGTTLAGGTENEGTIFQL